ncbi:alpha/beta hydrolase [Saccharothrix sp. AJ9571]|nr:alpha/beta hydrolase [Saccharothrix sp. AJ9571]
MGRVGHFTTVEGRARYFAAYDEAMRECPPERTELDVPSRYGTVRVYRYGSAGGAPIVLLHGSHASSAMWAPNLPGLIAERTVYTVDTLGEPGRSVQTSPMRDGAERARALEDVFEELGLDGFHLAGLSAGGWQTLNQARHFPGRLASIALFDPANTLGKLTKRFYAGATIAFLWPGDALMKRFLRWCSGNPPSMDVPAAKVLLAGMSEFRTGLPPLAYPDDGVLRSVRLPVFALIGGRSVVHDPEVAAERARTLFPRAEVELWPEATHALVGEQPERTVERLLEFVSDKG